MPLNLSRPDLTHFSESLWKVDIFEASFGAFQANRFPRKGSATKAVLHSPQKVSSNPCYSAPSHVSDHMSITPPKTNMDTQNYGLEKVTPFFSGHFGIYVRFLGCICRTIQCQLQDVANRQVPDHSQKGPVTTFTFFGPDTWINLADLLCCPYRDWSCTCHNGWDFLCFKYKQQTLVHIIFYSNLIQRALSHVDDGYHMATKNVPTTFFVDFLRFPFHSSLLSLYPPRHTTPSLQAFDLRLEGF